MNYDAIYDNLVARAKNRCILKAVYKERHHIVPKCVGGNNGSNNLIEFFPEEHYVAHLLLIKMKRYQDHANYKGLMFAANMLCVDSTTTKRSNNKRYGWLKRRQSVALVELMTGHKQSPEQITKRVAKTKGMKRTPEQRERCRLAKLGVKRKPFSEAALANMKASQQARCKKEREDGVVRNHSEETKKIMSALKQGYRPCQEALDKARAIASLPRSEETKRRMSIAGRARWNSLSDEEKEQHRNKRRKEKSDETKIRISLANKAAYKARNKDKYLRIIELLDLGLKNKDISATTGACKCTISKIKKNRQKILESYNAKQEQNKR